MAYGRDVAYGRGVYGRDVAYGWGRKESWELELRMGAGGLEEAEGLGGRGARGPVGLRGQWG